MFTTTLAATLVTVASHGVVANPDVERRVMNNGKLVLEDIPEIPQSIRQELYRWQDIRGAIFRSWSVDGKGIYVSTGFGSVDSLHKIVMPGGARRQLTFYREPIREISRRPGAEQLIFSRDANGSEFAQIYMFDGESGEASLLTDGESRNGAMVWDRRGSRIAYTSTLRDGIANDIWVMDPDQPDKAEIAIEVDDGFLWEPAEFSREGGRLLVQNYVSVTDSRAIMVNLDDGTRTLLAGGGETPSLNQPVAFDDDGEGFWLITDQGGEFNQLAWQSLVPGATPEIVTSSIPWNISDVVISDDRQRMAFVANENGNSRVYLMDPATREYRMVDKLPTGIAYGLRFSPDDKRLGLTLNSANAPSDAYVLKLGRGPLKFGRLVRWTESEVGGLVVQEFVVPDLVHYPTFDGREVPAWIHKPRGAGPHPVVIRIHGGPESQARPIFSSTFQFWVANLGAAVIQPNVRGSTGYGKTYVGLDNGVQREDAVRDIGSLLDWIETQPDLDASRIALYGGSYGGYMVLASAVHYSDRLCAVIDNVGISNFVSFLENTQDYRRDRRRQEYGDERDPEMRAHLERISPLNNVSRITVPMFIIQGQNDPRVPVTEATQMVEALRERGQSVWFMNALNEGHGYRKRENRDILQQVMTIFLREHLVGADSAP
ncbi:MAG: prolyl oligopeptidase family serine peptidase [Gammaproteobacteria bacterium]|nr:prolyl oligopeptidase family serine peptidase [Gammaproteobacteria bacterium]